MANPLLEVRNLSVSYGDVRALFDVSLTVEEGLIVALVGSNGGGKSTLLKTISGLLHPTGGDVLFEGESLGKTSVKQRVDKGIVQVPEGRRLFANLTIRENLRLGAYLPKARANYKDSLERVFGLFPVLKERQNGKAGLLSGGEQQMLAIGRAVMAQPKLIMIDEASLGLSPILTKTIFDLIDALHEQGTTTLLIEQNVNMALKHCDKAYVMRTGNIVMSGTGDELLADEELRKAYLGRRAVAESRGGES
ncbi:MAG: ABC transporter ATP-binding protein [Firmicutes bacterium]|nr:ABC transporter ATP-binding protein [Bacillota bacterium]